MQASLPHGAQALFLICIEPAEIDEISEALI